MNIILTCHCQFVSIQ